MQARTLAYRLLQVGMVLYGVLCVLVVFGAPLHEHDWMLAEPEAVKEGLAFCGLPQGDMLKVHVLAGIFLAPLWVLALGHFLFARRERWLWVALALTAAWLVRSILPWVECTASA